MPLQRQTTNNSYFGLHLFPAHSSDSLGISWSIRAMGGSFVIIIFGLLSSVPEIASEPSRCNGYLVIHSETLSTTAGFMLMRWLLEVGVLVARGTNQKRGGTFSPTPWSPGRGRAGGWLRCRWFNHDLISRACVTKIPHKPKWWGSETFSVGEPKPFHVPPCSGGSPSCSPSSRCWFASFNILWNKPVISWVNRFPEFCEPL